MSSDILIRDALKVTAVGGLALFSGAALYISTVQLPTILSESWVKMYKGAAPFQATLAGLSSAAALALGYIYNNSRWYQIGLLSGAIGAFTVIVMKPLVNDALHEADATANRDPSSTAGFEFAQTAQKHMKTWGLLHGVRTAVGITAFALAVRQVSRLIVVSNVL